MFLNINAKVRQVCKKFKSDKRGVTAVEYAIIAVTMSGIILTMLNTSGLGDSLESAMKQVTTSMGTGTDAETSETPKS